MMDAKILLEKGFVGIVRDDEQKCWTVGCYNNQELLEAMAQLVYVMRHMAHVDTDDIRDYFEFAMLAKERDGGGNESGGEAESCESGETGAR